MNINLVEAFWLIVCSVGIAVTVWLLADSFDEREHNKGTNGPRRALRDLIVRGNIRREGLRLIKQFCLLLLILPSLFRPGDVPLGIDLPAVWEAIQTGEWNERAQLTFSTLSVVILMLLPILLATQSYLDKRERIKLRVIGLEIVIVEKLVSDDAIAAAIAADRASTDLN